MGCLGSHYREAFRAAATCGSITSTAISNWFYPRSNRNNSPGGKNTERARTRVALRQKPFAKVFSPYGRPNNTSHIYPFVGAVRRVTLEEPAAVNLHGGIWCSKAS